MGKDVDSDTGNDAAMPPAYAHARDPGQQSPTSNVDITASFANLFMDDQLHNRGPDSNSCLAHLKLLHAIHALKEDVGYTDGLFGLYDSVAMDVAKGVRQGSDHVEKQTELGETEMRMLGLSKIREKRWALYVARAVERYESWWKCMQKSSYLTEDTMAEQSSELYSLFPNLSLSSSAWKMDILPPLDVLMVMHSHMLNPRAFLEDTMRASMGWLWQSGVPWHLINDAIDTGFDYNVPEACRKSWTQATGCSWSNVDDPLTKIIECPHCLVPNHIPWTTCNKNEKSDGTQYRSSSLVGSGFGDGKLDYRCITCERTICKEALSVRKFIQDTVLLLRGSIPMPGTILDPESGMPEVVPSGHLSKSFPRTFPNRMIKLSLRIQIQDIFLAHMEPTMETVRDMIEETMKDSKQLCLIDDVHEQRKYRKRLPPKSRTCVRKMMNRYWENFSPFALDLCGAVMRQGVFIDKMIRLDWLHSPSAKGTMSRLTKKYYNFMTLMEQYPKQIVVPTLDIDLAWHTHQLSPPSYYSYTIGKMKRFIDHDDKIEETKLSEAFEWTSKTYQQQFHALYSECTCWYCESIRASHTSSLASLFGGSKGDKYIERFYQSGQAQSCPSDRSAHISAHNAVRSLATDDKKTLVDFMRARQEAKLKQNYQKACKRAEKKGRKLPLRDEYYTHWGYAYYMYSPAAYPMYLAPDIYYGWDPCHTQTGPGAWGTCVAGSCGAGGIAAGSCGNAGGCGGAAACGSYGGCGGGGAGGGGGGCGGGGGGGCGGGGGGGGC